MLEKTGLLSEGQMDSLTIKTRSIHMPRHRPEKIDLLVTTLHNNATLVAMEERASLLETTLHY